MGIGTQMYYLYNKPRNTIKIFSEAVYDKFVCVAVYWRLAISSTGCYRATLQKTTLLKNRETPREASLKQYSQGRSAGLYETFCRTSLGTLCGIICGTFCGTSCGSFCGIICGTSARAFLRDFLRDFLQDIVWDFLRGQPRTLACYIRTQVNTRKVRASSPASWYSSRHTHTDTYPKSPSFEAKLLMWLTKHIQSGSHSVTLLPWFNTLH